MAQQLFKELDLTRENVERWAEDEAARKPIVNVQEWDGETKQYVVKEVPNSVERVLRSMIGKHFAYNLSESDEVELAAECLNYIMNGVDKPCCYMTRDELLDNITEELFENWEFDTLDDLLQWYGEGSFDF